MSVTIQSLRARIYAFGKLVTMYPDFAEFLRNGTIPDNEQVKEDFEILENEYFGKADADNKSPLSFTELCSFNTWFVIHPEKVAGKEVLTTSRMFPITIKGTKDDILKAIKGENQPKAEPDWLFIGVYPTGEMYADRRFIDKTTKDYQNIAIVFNEAQKGKRVKVYSDKLPEYKKLIAELTEKYDNGTATATKLDLWKQRATDLINNEIETCEIFGYGTYPRWITDNADIPVTDSRTGVQYKGYTLVKASNKGLKHWGKIAHFNIVKDAIDKGLDVPSEVLKDYPSIMQSNDELTLAELEAEAMLTLLMLNDSLGDTSDFGEVFTQFKGKPKQAIKHLLKVKQGEAVEAFYRDDIGYIDIVWGENDPKTNKGYGLKHIVEKHGKEIEQLGFKVEDFITMVVLLGIKVEAKEKEKILLESKMFRVVLMREWNGKRKTFILTAFDLRKKKTDRTVLGVGFI